jgi:predicted RNase H-like HicB family nuclease
MNKYLIIVEEGVEDYGAYAPDLPGCIAIAKTKEEVISIIQKSIESYLESFEQQGKPFPIPSRVENSTRKTSRELKEIFSSINLNWELKPNVRRVSYVVPTEEESIEIRNLINDVRKEDSDPKKFTKILSRKH